MTFAPMLARSLDRTALQNYTSNPNWYMEQKLDGKRCLIFVKDGVAQAVNRSGDPIILDAKLSEQFESFSGEWTFDGEDIKGDFWIFDMPEALGTVTKKMPFSERRKTLEMIFNRVWGPDNPHVHLIGISKTARQKRALVAWALKNNTEGIMLKLRSGAYRPGPSRSHTMFKAKFTETADCIISEVRREGKASCALELFHHGVRKYVGSVKMTEEELQRAKVNDVVEVKYLYATTGNIELYQSVFLGFRDDKHPEECDTSQLKFTNKNVRKVVNRNGSSSN